MGWTAPRTWVAGEMPTATIMNTHVRDNLDALKSPPTAYYAGAISASTSTASWLDIHANLTLNITTTGGDLLLFWFLAWNNNGTTGYLDIAIDGTRVSGSSTGLYGVVFGSAGSASALSGGPYIVLQRSVAAGVHTVKAQWWSVGGTSLTATASRFWVREV